MCNHKRVEDGYKWELTEEGRKLGRVAAKFEDGNPCKKAVEKTVPVSWFEKGYVRMVRL